MAKAIDIVFDPPHFKWHAAPLGFFTCKEHHALWYYYMHAINQWKDENGRRVVLEGEPDLNPNYKGLFQATALMYGVDIETLARHWSVIETEIARWNRYRLALNAEARQVVPRYDDLPEHLKFKNTPIIVSTKGVH